MTYKIHHNFFLVLLILLLLPFPLLANKTDSLGALINMAGKQRMLSQQIAKSYLFLGHGIRRDKARQQMNDGLKLFQQNHLTLKQSVKRLDIQDLLTFVDLAFQEYQEICKQPYSKDNGALILDLSETLLEVSHTIVTTLDGTSKTKASKTVNLAGRQRMLSQRIAKYYIAYQMGFRDNNSVIQLNNAVQDFELSLAKLSATKGNSKQLQGELRSIGSLWKVVRGFFIDIKKGGLPITVFATTDAILKRSDNVTQMFVTTSREKFRDVDSRVAAE